MKKKYTFIILLLFFSFLITVVNIDTLAEDENNNNDILSQLEKNTPVITIDCSKKKDYIFQGTIHDENLELGYGRVIVNEDPLSKYTTYINATTTDFEVNAADDFEDYSDYTYKRSNKIRIEAGSLIPSSSPYYHLTENGFGPPIIITCIFCDDQQCWSPGGGGSNFAQDTEAPYLYLYFEDYQYPSDPKKPEIKYATNALENQTKLEPEDSKQTYDITLWNNDDIYTIVKLIGLEKNTEVKPKGESIPFNFEAAILGIIISTVAIVLIRKRKKK